MTGITMLYSFNLNSFRINLIGTLVHKLTNNINADRIKSPVAIK